jgi:hypothetical protein
MGHLETILDVDVVQDLSLLNEYYLLSLLLACHLDLLELYLQITLHIQHLKQYCLDLSLCFS